MLCQAIINKTHKTQDERLLYELFHLADIKKGFSLVVRHHGKTKAHFCHGQTCDASGFTVLSRGHGRQITCRSDPKAAAP